MPSSFVVTGTAMWAARPDRRGWCAPLVDAASLWRPHPALDVDHAGIVTAVERAARRGAAWLFHPCCNRLTLPRSFDSLERDIRFITWVAVHADGPLGLMSLPHQSWRWSPAGQPVIVPVGRLDLAELASDDANLARQENVVALDPHCRALGFTLSGSWPECPAPAEASRRDLAMRELAHAFALTARVLPACAAWVSAGTSVVVPVRSSDATWSSGSQPELPGLIHVAGLNGPVAGLEGLVHESAHHHFTMIEAQSPLVDQGYDGLHPSPLRRRPRPLAKVLLAVHALAHIAKFYEDAIDVGLLSGEWSDRRATVASLRDAGLATLADAYRHLTPAGDTLVRALAA
jgi:HEXXH motif-containing protein